MIVRRVAVAVHDDANAGTSRSDVTACGGEEAGPSAVHVVDEGYARLGSGGHESSASASANASENVVQSVNHFRCACGRGMVVVMVEEVVKTAETGLGHSVCRMGVGDIHHDHFRFLEEDHHTVSFHPGDTVNGILVD